MSGGSYDYLYSKYAYQLVTNYEEALDTLRRMTDRLKELGFPKASQKTFKIFENLVRVRVEMDSLTDRMDEMFDIFHAVEWLDSFDSGLEEVKKAIEESGVNENPS